MDKDAKFVDWLDSEIAAVKKQIKNRSVSVDSFGYILGKKDALVSVKEIYSSMELHSIKIEIQK